MDDFQFYVLFNSISVIPGRGADNNERLYAMEPQLWLRRFHLERVSVIAALKSLSGRANIVDRDQMVHNKFITTFYTILA